MLIRTLSRLALACFLLVSLLALPAMAAEPGSKPGANTAGNVQIQPWTEGFRLADKQIFLDLFTENMAFEASISELRRGQNYVAQAFMFVSTLYEYCTFTNQIDHGNRRYLEWELTTKSGMPMSGITVLVFNKEGKVYLGQNYHSPYPMMSKFIDELLAARQKTLGTAR